MFPLTDIIIIILLSSCTRLSSKSVKKKYRFVEKYPIIGGSFKVDLEVGIEYEQMKGKTYFPL